MPLEGEETAAETAAVLRRLERAWRTAEGSEDREPWANQLARVLDQDGVPKTLRRWSWPDVLGSIVGWIKKGSRDDTDLLAVSGFFRALLRFTRPDGSSIFGPRGKTVGQGSLWRGWSDVLDDSTLEWVVARWFPSRSRALSHLTSPALPTDSRPDRVLAVLRPDWTAHGDWVAVDHRCRVDTTLLEVAGGGLPWLGPGFRSGAGADLPIMTSARPSYWTTGAFADCLEWTYRRGPQRITRTVALLRGRGMAIVAEQSEGPLPTSDQPEELRVDLAEGVRADALPDLRAFRLSYPARKRGPIAWVVPLGLPALSYPTDLGRLALSEDERSIVLKLNGGTRRRWRALLIGWERPPRTWRVATVAEHSKACAPGDAFAVRIGWGLGHDGLVVYRSLAPTTLRSFLGHQTRARFVVGTFSPTGNIKPILQVY